MLFRRPILYREELDAAYTISAIAWDHKWQVAESI